jgi:hypothetical protein
MESTPEAGEGSLAASLRVTERLAVEAASPLMAMVPFGRTVSTNQLRDAGVVSVLPTVVDGPNPEGVVALAQARVALGGGAE